MAPKATLAPVAVLPKIPERSAEAEARAAFLQKHRLAPALVLALLTFTVYIQTVHHPYTNYDDSEYVQDNTNIHQGITLSMLRWAFTSTEHTNWHPVTWISHAIDWQLFGSSPGGHHFTSMLLHMIAAVLLFLFLAESTGSTLKSLAVAVLFAIHPVSVESVVWISERKNVLCALFFFAALLAYVYYARAPRLDRYLLVALLFALSLASKAMAVTFPFVLLLVDFWPLQRIEGWTRPSGATPVPQVPVGKIILEKIPFLAGSIAVSTVTLIAQRFAIKVAVHASLGLRLANALVSYSRYLWNFVWPTRLSVLYPYPSSGIPAWKVVLCAGLLVAISVYVWWQRSRSYLVTGWCWFLGVLVPVIGLVQVGEQAMADRYAYLPLAGIYVLAVWGFADFMQSARPRLRPVMSLAAAAALLALTAMGWSQVRLWRTNLDLWTRAVEVTENNSSAEDVVGAEMLMAAFNKGLEYSDESQVHFQNALRIDPTDGQALMYTAMNLQAHRRLPEAIDTFKSALQHADDNWLRSKVLSGMATCYELMGDYPTARKYFQDALKASPKTDSEAFMGYARTFTDEQIAHLTAELASHPTPEGYLQLGRLQESAARPNAAMVAYRHALDLNGNLEAARAALARIGTNPQTKPSQ